MNCNLLTKRILIAEDEHFMRMLLIQALNSLGFDKIYEAEHGRHALQIMDKHPIDIIISDIEMKPLNGLELVKMIRAGKTPIARDTQVIVLTGFSDISTLSLTLELDVQGFLVKPVSANDLLNKIQSITDMKIQLKAPSAYDSLCFAPTRISSDIKHSISKQNPTKKTITKTSSYSPKKQAEKKAEQNTQQIPADHQLLGVYMLRPGMVVRKDIFAR
jgi:YesN/AraC family two-component response regulator